VEEARWARGKGVASRIILLSLVVKCREKTKRRKLCSARRASRCFSCACVNVTIEMSGRSEIHCSGLAGKIRMYLGCGNYMNLVYCII
jgi:hypothetical protein